MRVNADLFCFMPEEYECISYCITGINIFTRLNKECPCVCARVCVRMAVYVVYTKIHWQAMKSLLTRLNLVSFSMQGVSLCLN